MKVTEAVTVVHGDRGPGRIVFRADDEALTPYAGLVCVGEVVRRTGLVELVDGELAAERRAAPVKRRRRGVSGGELVVALAESQLVGGECFEDIEELRADTAGTSFRAVAAVPAAATALQLAKRFRRCLCQAVERGLARAGELVAGNREKLSAAAAARICRRALRMLPAGHGPVTFRVDSAYYALELLRALRARRARFTVSVPRTGAMWKALKRIADDVWQPATDMDDAEVAETTYTPVGWRHEPLRLIVRRRCFAARELARSPRARRLKTIHPDQLQLALEGKLASVYGYSFILTDIHDQDATWIEHFHHHRAQIEERLKDAKLGQALRRLPSKDINANRLWLTAVISALNLSAMLCDLSPLAGASGQAPDAAPLRRHAKTLRRALLCVPARITRHARATTFRLAAGCRHRAALEATWAAAHALPPP